MTAIRTVRPIADVAAEIGIRPEHLVPYGHDKAKVRLAALGARGGGKPGKLVLVSALTPTSAGEGKIEIRTDDSIASDAAAGSDYIKMREDRFFSRRDLDLLEAHEGWVHVSTTMNGLAQPVCTFLGKAAPRTTVTQEGLAVLTEMLNLRSHPMRLAKLMRRIDAIEMAAGGATFLDVFESLRVDGLTEDDAWVTTSRVFV